jgi:hypothetical protein
VQYDWPVETFKLGWDVSRTPRGSPALRQLHALARVPETVRLGAGEPGGVPSDHGGVTHQVTIAGHPPCPTTWDSQPQAEGTGLICSRLSAALTPACDHVRPAVSARTARRRVDPSDHGGVTPPGPLRGTRRGGPPWPRKALRGGGVYLGQHPASAFPTSCQHTHASSWSGAPGHPETLKPLLIFDCQCPAANTGSLSFCGSGTVAGNSRIGSTASL